MTPERVPMCLFAKPPRSGQVKTRLIPALGASAAAELARAFIVDAWATIGSLDWAAPVVATTDPHDPFWAELPNVTVWPQGTGDLGTRMQAVLDRARTMHRAAIVVGADAPGLPSTVLQQARRALDFADVVLGPAADGGFYLVGATRHATGDLFAGVEWSTSHTLAATEARIRGLGRSVIRVAPWFDVDRVEDLERLRHLGDRFRQAAPETARVIDAVWPAPPTSSSETV